MTYCTRCGGEGRLYTSRYGGNDPDVSDAGECPVCEGTGMTISELEPDESAELTAKGEKLMLGEAPTPMCPKADLAEKFQAYAEGFRNGHAHALEVDDCETGYVAEEVAEECFVRGAQAMREMLARFVEQGDATTAASIRANWHPDWGADPGKLDGDIPSDAWSSPQAVAKAMEHFHAVRRDYEK